VRADANAALPIRTAGVDAVTAVWWLHMVDDPHGVLREVSRVLRLGGIFVTAADKQAVDELATDKPAGGNWTSDTCGLLAGAAQQIGLHLAGAAALGGYGHLGGALNGSPCPTWCPASPVALCALRWLNSRHAHGLTVPARGKLRPEVWDTWRAAHL
jgi:SAM-dependent methyltransferase